ncbi:MAG: hypothetical protein ACYCT0_08505 [Sulfobacillus sp.]
MQIAQVAASATYVGRWGTFYGYQWDSWVFLVVFTAKSTVCVSVWRPLWWARRVGPDAVWLDDEEYALWERWKTSSHTTRLP